jgi:hypothetical protein
MPVFLSINSLHGRPALLGWLMQSVYFQTRRIGEGVHRIVRIAAGIRYIHGVFALFAVPLVFAFVAGYQGGGHYKDQQAVLILACHDKCLVFGLV